MRPASRFTYALKALVDLSIHQASGPVTVAAIARRQGIPLRYLEQLFNRLRRERLIQAERGPRGGYRLNRPAGEIPVSEIFRILEPRASLAKATSLSDPTASVWKKVEQAVETTLKATSLETLAAQARENSQFLNHRYTFHI